MFFLRCKVTIIMVRPSVIGAGDLCFTIVQRRPLYTHSSKPGGSFTSLYSSERPEMVWEVVSFVFVCSQVVCYHSHALHDSMTPGPRTSVDSPNSFMFTQNLMFHITAKAPNQPDEKNMMFPSALYICPPYRQVSSVRACYRARCSCSSPL